MRSREVARCVVCGVGDGGIVVMQSRKVEEIKSN